MVIPCKMAHCSLRNLWKSTQSAQSSTCFPEARYENILSLEYCHFWQIHSHQKLCTAILLRRAFSKCNMLTKTASPSRPLAGGAVTTDVVPSRRCERRAARRAASDLSRDPARWRAIRRRPAASRLARASCTCTAAPSRAERRGGGGPGALDTRTLSSRAPIRERDTGRPADQRKSKISRARGSPSVSASRLATRRNKHR